MKLRVAAALVAAGLAFGLVVLTAGIGGGSRAAPGAAVGAELDSGRAVFARMGCGGCHTLAAAGSQGQIGPNLDDRLPSHTRASLVERITRPPSIEGEFSPMPTDFGVRLDRDELNALVDFLLAAR